MAEDLGDDKVLRFASIAVAAAVLFQNMQQRGPEQKAVAERHIQTVLVAVVIALLSWVGLTLTGLQTDVAALHAWQTAADQKFEEISTNSRNQFTSTDADAMRETMRIRFDGVEKDIQALLARVRDMENGSP